jgi:dolichyldiphosphatase
MDDPPLASLSLTHVHYNPEDSLSYISAYLALVPQALVITYAALIWSTREIEILLMFAGQMGCEGLNWILKRWIKEDRPTRTLWLHASRSFQFVKQMLNVRYVEMLGKGYGMPSSHAQFVAYFSTFLVLFMLLRHDPLNHPHASRTHEPIPFWHRGLISVAAIICAAAVALSRVYLNYHRPLQVYVGVATGVSCAVAWFIITGLARNAGLIEWLLDLPPARWARMRDLVVNEDLVDAGWERWERRRRSKTGEPASDGRKTR